MIRTLLLAAVALVAVLAWLRRDDPELWAAAFDEPGGGW